MRERLSNVVGVAPERRGPRGGIYCYWTRTILDHYVGKKVCIARVPTLAKNVHLYTEGVLAKVDDAPDYNGNPVFLLRMRDVTRHGGRSYNPGILSHRVEWIGELESLA